MANIESKVTTNPPLKLEKGAYAAQIGLRSLVIIGTISGMWLMLTSKQSTVIYGIDMDARYNYSSAFKFIAIANGIACAFTVVSLFSVIIFTRRGSNPLHCFLLFMNDLIMAVLVLAGCASATAIGFVGKYGNVHTGWIAICDNFGKFCNRVTTSVILSYFSCLFLLILTVISANKSMKLYD